VKLPFVKLHGCANDYVLVDGFAHARPEWGPFAIAACERRRGVGADGLLVVGPPSDPQRAQARMTMINPDGSEAEMCGNGLRCLGKFLFDRGRVAREFTIETRAGPVPMRVEQVDAAGKATELSAALGIPDFERARVPMTGPATPALGEAFALSGRMWKVSALRLGNPHCVIFVDDVDHFPVHSLGPAVERDPRFPQRINVSFVQVTGEDSLSQRTWERGVGETLACGSGVTAAAIVARKLHGFGPSIRVHVRGGDLAVEWPGEGQPARLRGPAVEVFEGTLEG